MNYIFPDRNAAADLFQQGQDYMIDEYGKSVVLYSPAYLVTGSGLVQPGNFGNDFMFGGQNSFEPADNYLAGSGSVMVEQRNTKTIKLFTTVNPRHMMQKTKYQESINIKFKNEANYIYSKGYMNDYLDVINADYAIFMMPSSTIDRLKFRVASRPQDKNSLVQGRYFTCWWEEIN